MMRSTTLAQTREWSVILLFLTHLNLGGNQYEYEGNDFQKLTYQANAVEESIEATIVNQEIGRSPLEFFNPLTRAKSITLLNISLVTEMKNLKPGPKVKGYSALY